MGKGNTLNENSSLRELLNQLVNSEHWVKEAWDCGTKNTVLYRENYIHSEFTSKMKPRKNAI